MCIPFAGDPAVHRISTFSLAFITFLAVITACDICRAQSTNASLSGVVKDASGGIVPKAELVLTSEQTKTESRFTTGKDGLVSLRESAGG